MPLGSRCHTIGSMEGAVRRQKEPVIGTRMPTGVVVIKLKQSSNTEAQGSTFKSTVIFYLQFIGGSTLHHPCC